jgi:hypothetical protein
MTSLPAALQSLQHAFFPDERVKVQLRNGEVLEVAVGQWRKVYPVFHKHPVGYMTFW